MKRESPQLHVRSGIRAGGKSEDCKKPDYPYKDGSGRCIFIGKLACCSKP